MTNKELFEYSGRFPEPIIDLCYKNSNLVITSTSDTKNRLMRSNEKLIELITVFNYLTNCGKDKGSTEIKDVVEKIIEILDDVAGINFTAFSQFFMVYSSAHASYLKYSPAEKKEFVYQMLCLYRLERHAMYLSHGYTNSMLQIIADNYSHKRKSKATITKVVNILTPYGFNRLSSADFETADSFYILPDKGDKKLFLQFKSQYGVEMTSAEMEQKKLPDMLFKFKGHFFIAELKNMKGSGGGQDKQIVEVINFIRYSETNPKIHYLTFLDGEYANLLFRSHQPKIRRQYADIIACLETNPGNYFVNTAGFTKFLSEFTG